jgi:hypothetical protein
MLEFLYITGVAYYTILIGKQRDVNPQCFMFDFITTFLILLWPLTFGLMLLKGKT